MFDLCKKLIVTHLHVPLALKEENYDSFGLIFTYY